MKRLYFQIIFYVALFLAVASFISALYTDVITLTILILILLIITFKFDYRKDDLYHVIIGVIAGSLIEIICIYFGVWHYANPTFFSIPLWLPVAWGLAALAIKRTAVMFSEARK